MILKNKQWYDAMMSLIHICNGNQLTVPQLAKFKLARMHDKLEPIFMALEKQRVALVMQYGSEKFADPDTKQKSLGWNIDKSDVGHQAFVDGWEAILNQEQEVKITPITTVMLGDDAKGLEVMDYKMLGPLVVDPTEEKE